MWSVSTVTAAPLHEDEVKAVYSYQFGKFVEWPSAAFDPTVDAARLCILGRNPFSRSAMTVLDSKRLKGLPLKVFVYERVLHPADRQACHIVFVSDSESGRLGQILTELRELPVLTVSDIPDFTRRGGMIGLYRSGDHVRFDVNRQAADRAGLKISSKLLMLAEVSARPSGGQQ